MQLVKKCVRTERNCAGKCESSDERVDSGLQWDKDNDDKAGNYKDQICIVNLRSFTLSKYLRDCNYIKYLSLFIVVRYHWAMPCKTRFKWLNALHCEFIQIYQQEWRNFRIMTIVETARRMAHGVILRQLHNGLLRRSEAVDKCQISLIDFNF